MPPDTDVDDGGPLPPDDPSPSSFDAAFAVVRELADDRPDLVDRLEAAFARASRPTSIVCVVGEFKQGKSSLVNGMVGAAVCPVDDDLATSAITLVHGAEKPSATVRTRSGGRTERIVIEPDELSRFVTESGNPGNRLGVERVDVGLPSDLLADGLCLVDTPGTGSLGAGHAAATLAFIPFADGLVFVSDASSELTATEVDFLREARALCPTLMVVQPKIDVSPEWRRIVELNRGHLDRAGVDARIWPVSTSLRFEALGTDDAVLDERSGFPEMLRALRRDVVEPSRTLAAARAAADALSVADQLHLSLEHRRAVLTDPARRAALAAEADEAVRRLEQLRGPGARWATVLGDRVTDLQASVNHQLRRGSVEVVRSFEERIETLKTAEEWDRCARDLQTAAASYVLDLFRTVEAGRSEVRAEIAELVGADDLITVGERGTGSEVDVTRFWRDRRDVSSGAGAAARVGLSGLRGLQSGVVLLGTLTQLLPVAAAGLLATNPVLLTVGAMFGGVSVLDDRKRKVAAMRQAARIQIRQFLDDLSLEIGNELSTMVRQLQRDLRDEFAERIGELQRTYADAARQANETAHGDEATREQRVEFITRRVDQLGAAAAVLRGYLG